LQAVSSRLGQDYHHSIISIRSSSSSSSSSSSNRNSKGSPAYVISCCPISHTRGKALHDIVIARACAKHMSVMQVGGSILGGEQRNKEKARLRKGITAFKTDELRWLVLDEADRLLDMGFQQKIGKP